LFGDRNTEREQGQVVLENSRISNSEGFGVVLQPDPRTTGSNSTNPGSVRNTITLNNQRLVPGAVVMNNELVGNGAGGISITGDAGNPNQPPAPVPFARIINNTILGGQVVEETIPASSTVQGDFYSLGSISFADAVTRYDAAAGGGPIPIPGLRVAADSLGAPNYTGIGEPIAGQGAVSLGRGGVLVVQFVNNILTGSNDPSPDLAIYEVGTGEQVRVEVSADNVVYTSVGTASLTSRYIDLDAFGFNGLSQLYYVRLTDVINDGATTGDSVGADIDAVGALSSRPGQTFSASGVGIRVGSNASPTLLNNIIVNHTDGLDIASTSTSTVVGATLFQRNTRNTTGSATPGQFPLFVPEGVPLFTDPASRNLYPVPNSRAIDATIDSLIDRAALLSVKQPLGLAASPIIAPTLDINGMLRVDDPDVQTPPGLGEGIFKDRGASDRSDFVGPIAIAINPQDNDSLGADKNPNPGTVEIANASLNFFDIQIIDTSLLGNLAQGTGIDVTSVSTNAVLLYKDGQVQVEGKDYRFGFDPTSNIVRLTPIAGIWEPSAVYQIRFINTDENAILVSDPQSIVDGTIFSVLDNSNKTTRFELDTGIRIRVPISLDGLTSSIADGTIFRIDDGFQRITFEFDNDGAATNENVQILFNTQDSPLLIAEKIVAAIRGTALTQNVTARVFGDGSVQIFGNNQTVVLPETSRLVVSGTSGVTPGYGFRVPSANGVPVGIADGQVFAIQRGNNTSVFELDTDGQVRLGAIPVAISTASAGVMAASIAAAINAAGLGLTATASAEGLVAVGAQSDLRLQATSTVLQVVGTPGFPAATRVEIDLSTTLSAEQASGLLAQSIIAANLPGVSVTQLGQRILIEGAQGVGGQGAFRVSGIRDRAGNQMRATEPNGQTLTTIFVGEGRDYGDAADPLYPSRKVSNGARHIVVEGFSLGPTVTADADARLTDEDLDDGVTVNGFTQAFVGSISVNVQGASPSRIAYVNAWIDLDADGSFEPNERIATEQAYFNDGTRVLSIPRVPLAARTDQPVAIRVRMSSQSGLGPTGEAPDGEVEDYYTTIRPNPYTNQRNRLDVSGDGAISPIDVLQVVNYINFSTGGVGGPLPFPPTTSGPPFLDVDGDGFVGPLDALAIINFINSRPASGGEGEGADTASYDTWVAAPATNSTPHSSSAPLPSTSASNSTSTSSTSSESSSRSVQSLDDYLATLTGEIGPTLATEELDFASMFGTAEEESEAKDDEGVMTASTFTDDVFSDWS
jgi:large repetitive protein